ncbi:Aste57867_11476 [Aphanomyces stellatus]|uniref:Aste57867_11476 protein n=1 Tax=Aphanomyces stellatus TaxID=120398 RepID=A0A485KT37_9STRA|nr:hypothetical protein As57867_011433 [Aphanomyces stellatus]VFT88337.1 Aste57867_11476 [Aphanomyces stellatus]
MPVDGVWWASCGPYAIVFALGAYRLWLNWNRDRAAMALYVNVLVGCCWEIGGPLLDAVGPTAAAISAVGDMFFVAAFLLILHNWSRIAKQMETGVRSTSAPAAVIAFVGLNGIAYTTDAVLFGIELSKFSSLSSLLCDLHCASHGLLLLLSATAVGVFPYYANRMRLVLVKVGEDSPKRLRNIFSIAALAMLYFVATAIAQILDSLRLLHACTLVAPLSWPLVAIKGACVVLLLFVLPWRPAPSKHGYIRLRSHNAG